MKLSAKYATTLLTLIFCVVLGFSAVIFFHFRNEIRTLNSRSAAALGNSVLKEIEAQKILSSRVLAAALTNPLYQLDLLKINELIEAVREQPNVRYVYIFDEKRRIVHDGTKELVRYNELLDDELTVNSMQSADSFTLLEKDLLHVSTPIRLHDEVVGGVRMGFALNNILHDIALQQGVLDTNYENAAKNQFYFIVIIGVIVSICGLLASVALARSWSKPIIFLSNLTAKIGKGEYEVAIPIDRTDEIGSLAAGFREMVRSLTSLRLRESEQSEALLQANVQLQRSNHELKTEIAERQRAQQEVSRQHEHLRTLHEIGAAINRTLDQSLLLDALFDKVECLLPYSATSICLHEPSTGLLIPIAQRNLSQELWENEPRGIGDSVALRISKMLVEQKNAIVVQNISHDARTAAFEPLQQNGWLGFVGLPLTAEGKVIGALAFYLRQPREFTNEEIEFLFTLAGQVALAVLNSQLYEHLRQQTIDLENANKAKDEFLNVMSHELRTPLNVISGYAQVLAEGILGDANAEQQKIADKIIAQSGELNRMINEVLQVGSLQGGKVQVYFENTNLNDLLQELKGEFDVLPKKSIELTWNIPPNIPTVKTDGDKLKHVLQNIIHNALKFTEDGSVTVSARGLSRCFEFKVKDTGVGINQELLPVIFDMFRQVDSSKTRTHGGVGVGLFIVKKFVELLNGTIEVESAPGLGTTFTLTIPADEIAENPAPPLQDNGARLTA